MKIYKHRPLPKYYLSAVLTLHSKVTAPLHSGKNGRKVNCIFTSLYMEILKRTQVIVTYNWQESL